MTYKTGAWGEKAKIRSAKRKQYFREYKKLHPQYERKGQSGFGRDGELEAIKLLKGAIDRNKNTVADYDISWNGQKIEVKTAHLKHYKDGSANWKFYLKRQKGKVDFFLLLCFIESELAYSFLIPDSELKVISVNIAFSTVKKYFKYLIQ